MKNYIQHSLLILTVAVLTMVSESVLAQSVSINSTGAAPHPNAVLDVSTTTTQGVLLARMTTATRTGWSPTTSGVTVYDTNTESYWYWDDTANLWREIPNTAGIVTTLDGSYDGGTAGSGNGRIIIADAGAVDIQDAGGLLVNGPTGLGTGSPDGSYALTALTGAGPSIKVGSTSLGILVESNAGGEDGISSIQSSGANASAYYAIRGEVTNESGVGYLGYHTTTDNSYAVYGQSGTYAGYFDGDVNLTGELQLNGSPGTSGQVLMSAGAGSDAVWGTAAGDIESVTAGNALSGGGTTGALTIDVEADNGLNIDVANDVVQLGGDLTEATEVQLEGFDLSLDLNGTGEFIVQDGNVDHFKIGNNGDASFGSDTYFKDTNTGGTDLVVISDAGTGGNDGRIQIFQNGTVNHTIHGDGDVEFNEVGGDRNFRIESTNDINMFFLDAGNDRIGLGTGSPSRTLHVDGEARVQGLANASGAVVVSNNQGDLNDLAFTGSATDVLLGNGAFGAASTLNDNDWLQVVTSGAPSAVGDWIYTNGNVGVNFGAAANPYAALHVKTQAYIGDDNSASFFNSNAILHLARTDNPHLLMEDVGNNTGGLSFDGGGMNVVTENGDIDFRTGVTFNGDFSATGTSRMIIQNGGNVGIGTITPDADLNIGNAGGATLYLTREDPSTEAGEVLGSILFDNTDNTVVSSVDAAAGIRAYADQNQGNSNKSGYMTFFTKDNVGENVAATERMRITADGNLVVGASTPILLAAASASGAKFYVAGDATITGKMNSNGIQESSDRRFKKNIQPLSGALDKVMALEGVTYNWKTEEFPDRKFGSRTEIGVIAQEIEKVYPELVATDADGYKSVQYSHMVPVLLEAIKEQQKIIENLDGNVEALTSELKDVNNNYSRLFEEIKRFSAELDYVKSASEYSAD